MYAGLVTWAVIIASTVLWQFPAALESLVGLAKLVKSLASGASGSEVAAPEWSFLPVRMTTA